MKLTDSEFQALYLQYNESLRIIAENVNAPDPEIVAHKALEKAVREATTLGDLRRFAKTNATRLGISQRRQFYHESRSGVQLSGRSLDEYLESRPSGIRDTSAEDPAEIVIRRETIREAIGEMTDAERRVVALLQAGYKRGEIARMLNIKPKSVTGKGSDVRQRLRSKGITQ